MESDQIYRKNQNAFLLPSVVVNDKRVCDIESKVEAIANAFA